MRQEVGVGPTGVPRCLRVAGPPGCTLDEVIPTAGQQVHAGAGHGEDVAVGAHGVASFAEQPRSEPDCFVDLPGAPRPAPEGRLVAVKSRQVVNLPQDLSGAGKRLGGHGDDKLAGRIDDRSAPGLISKYLPVAGIQRGHPELVHQAQQPAGPLCRRPGGGPVGPAAGGVVVGRRARDPGPGQAGVADQQDVVLHQVPPLSRDAVEAQDRGRSAAQVRGAIELPDVARVGDAMRHVIALADDGAEIDMVGVAAQPIALG